MASRLYQLAPPRRGTAMAAGAAGGVALDGGSMARHMPTVPVPTTTAAIGMFALEHHTARVGVVCGSADNSEDEIIATLSKPGVVQREMIDAAQGPLLTKDGPPRRERRPVGRWECLGDWGACDTHKRQGFDSGCDIPFREPGHHRETREAAAVGGIFCRADGTALVRELCR